MHAQLACHNSWWTVSSSDSLHVAKRCVDRTMASWWVHTTFLCFVELLHFCNDERFVLR
jgi:hypothetical protein